MAWTTPRTWTDGELLTKAIMDPHVRDNLNFLRNITKSMFVFAGYASGAGVVLHDTGGAGGQAASRLVDAAENALQFNVALPAEFQSITKAAIVGAALGTGNIRRIISSVARAEGEDYSLGGGSGVSTSKSVTANLVFEDDVDAALIAVWAAGDYVSVEYRRYGAHVNDTVNADVLIFGLIVEWA